MNGSAPDVMRRTECVTTAQRVNTRGGKLEGSCDSAGSFKAVPYSAEYLFLKKD